MLYWVLYMYYLTESSQQPCKGNTLVKFSRWETDSEKYLPKDMVSIKFLPLSEDLYFRPKPDK